MASYSRSGFGVGEVLSQSFAVFAANVVPFCALALILMLPSLVYGLIVLANIQVAVDAAGGISFLSLLAIVIQMVLSQLTAAAIAYGSFQYLNGNPISLGDCISRGLALLLPVIGVAVLTGLAIGIGMILLVVPGIIAAVMLWVAIPAAVVERPGVIDSLKRSAALTKGRRWSVFGVMIVIVVAGLVVSLILQFILLSIAGFYVYSIGSWVVQGVLGAFYAVTAAVGYYLLRVEKEGINIEDIAKVFD